MKHIAALAPVLFPCLLNAQLVINEVDYDQPGTDAAEYIEIKNIDKTAFPLQDLSIVLVNGAAGTAATYLTISSPTWPLLPAGGYFVICANAATANCGFVTTPANNLIQNGVPDAIALVNSQTDEVMDILSYGGDVTGYTEGTGTAAVDVNAVDDRSLNRWPDGADTNDNNADFRLGCSTPGATNLVDDVLCSVPASVAEMASSAPLIVMPDPSGERLLLSYGTAADGPVTFEVFGRDGALLATRTVQGDTKAIWSMPVHDLRGQLLLVRAFTATSQQTRRVVLP